MASTPAQMGVMSLVMIYREWPLCGGHSSPSNVASWPEAVLHPVLFDLSPARSGRSRTPLPPVTWSTGMMGECDDEDLPRAFQNDDIKRKALEAQTFHTARPGR